MCFSTGELTLKTRVGVLSTVVAHGGPVAPVFQKFIHLLASNMVVLHVNFLHNQQLVSLWSVVDPCVVLPRQ